MIQRLQVGTEDQEGRKWSVTHVSVEGSLYNSYCPVAVQEFQQQHETKWATGLLIYRRQRPAPQFQLALTIVRCSPTSR